ncbi:MAG: hypothetical protein H5T63_10485 [Chloroflexi bacterium]|nr:hypothetical protein [Chloroflexota bacterium]
MASKPGVKLANALPRLFRALFSALRNYVMNVRGKEEAAGFAVLQSLAGSSPLCWPGLATLLVTIAAAVYLSLYGSRFPLLTAEMWEGEIVQAPSPALYLSLAAISFGWAYFLVGTTAFGLGAYVVAAAYTAFYGLFPGFSLLGTLWFTLVPIWLLVLGGWTAASRPTLWRLPLLLLLSLLVALITYPSLHLKTILPGTGGRLVLAGIYFALVANPWAMRERSFKPALAFAVSLGFFLFLYALSLQRSLHEEVFGYTFLAFHDLLGLVSLFWFWMGLDLFRGAQSLAGWLADTVKSLIPRRMLDIALFSLLILWGAIAYILVHGPSVGLLNPYWEQALWKAYLSLDLSTPLILALNYQLYLIAAICLVVVLLWLAKRLTSERLLSLFGLSLLGFFILYGGFNIWIALGSEEWGTTLEFWPLFIFVAGMFWQFLKAGSDLITGAKAQVFLLLAFLLIFGGISLLELSAGYPYFNKELTLNPFLGALYLGLPYLLYSVVYQKRRHDIPSSHLMLLFALGMLSAIPSLATGWLLIAPLIWLAIFLATSWRWEHRDGFVYGLALSLGFTAFYTHPVIIQLPAFTSFLGRFVQLQARYAENVIWPWEARWWWLLLAASGSAIILGFLLSRARLAQGRRQFLLLILGTSLSLAFLTLCAFALPGLH